MTMYPCAKPWPRCARCDHEVAHVALARAGDTYEMHVICHGHVDVFVLDVWTRYALSGPLSEADLVRAFTGGPGRPVEVAP